MAQMHRGYMIAVPFGTSLIAAKGTRAWLTPSERDHAGTTVWLLDLETGAELARRTFANASSPSLYGDWLVLTSAQGQVIAPSDLSADARAFPFAERVSVLAVNGGVVALDVGRHVVGVDVTTFAERYRHESHEPIHWSGDTSPLLLGTVGVDVMAMRVVDGAVLWRVPAFGPVAVDELAARPVQPTPSEVHMRADSFLEGRAVQLVARLDASTGRVLGVRTSSPEIPAWLPDLTAAQEAALARFEGHQYAIPGGVIVVGTGEMVLVRAESTQRVAIPSISFTFKCEDDHIAGLARIGDNLELVVVPYPSATNVESVFDLELAPRGAFAPVGEKATVSFAGTSAPFFVVQHPTRGRITITLPPGRPMPNQGDEVRLEGISVNPANVVSVAGYNVVGTEAVRTVARYAAGAERVRQAPVKPLLVAIVSEIRERAGASTVPAHVIGVCELAERNPEFKQALAMLGVHFGFAEEYLLLEQLEECLDPGFVPVWTNGYGDAAGVLIGNGALLALVRLPEGETMPLGTDFVQVIRDLSAESPEQAATVAFVNAALDRLAAETLSWRESSGKIARTRVKFPARAVRPFLMMTAYSLSPSRDERNAALVAHAGTLFAWFLAPLVVYVVKKNDSRYVAQQALASLCWSLTGTVVAALTFGIAIPVFLGVHLYAAWREYHGETFEYPFVSDFARGLLK